MGEHGILFQDEMVRALLRPVGDPLRKTVTRRTSDRWAKVKPGDLLWVRECWRSSDMGPARPGAVAYRADYTAERIKRDRLGPWKPSMVMPRWASRLTLRVVSVQRERADECRNTQNETLEDRVRCALNHCPKRTGCLRLPTVDDAEARREGVENRAAYLRLWESISGSVYPAWVWRIEFEEVERG